MLHAVTSASTSLPATTAALSDGCRLLAHRWLTHGSVKADCAALLQCHVELDEEQIKRLMVMAAPGQRHSVSSKVLGRSNSGAVNRSTG